MPIDEIRKTLRKCCNDSSMTMEQVAAAGKVTKKTLYNFFDGTSDLGSENLESLLNVFGRTLKAGKLKKK
ncbi:hypothetical protein KS4_18300 [Poriferisphaera corsica]|uniref:HTH cro/C1-type domain-containing protein n=1 Tax=Poriferisphaera corsica TaxID=2528020 RepID=A0A517YU62_9BACT|nr:helix-turn-helix transcriptional regulator [Poriferisphaera corsica]QDU33773.1 hypothetical protein KS4_18300 [Poriferisphaera corsica]